MLQRLVDLVKAKFDGESAVVYYTGPNKLQDSNAFIFVTGSDGWTVYQGCELIVGDTTLEYCAQCVLDVIELNHR